MCVIHGDQVPTEAPAQFCWTSCIEAFENRSSCPKALEGSFSSYGRKSTDFGDSHLELDESSSVHFHARVKRLVRTVEIEKTLAASGYLDVDMNDCGPGTPCVARISRLVIGTDASLNLDDETVDGLSAENGGVLEFVGEPDPSSPRRTLLSMPAGAILGGGFRVDGGDREGFEMVADRTATGVIDWEANTLEIQFHTDVPDSPVRFDLFLHMPLRGRAPVAEVPDVTVECTGPAGSVARLDGSGSTDPDGIADIATYAWSRVSSTSSWSAGSGAVLDVQAPFGDSDYTLTVVDQQGATSIDSARIHVIDTTPPQIEGIDLRSDCLWPPNHKAFRFELGRDILVDTDDTCGVGSTSVRILSAVSSESPVATGSGSTDPDVRFSDQAVCLRSERSGSGTGRVYTITIEAIDSHGNAETRDVQVRVPHDLGGSSTCVGVDELESIDLDDPSCGDALVPSAGSLSDPPSSGTAVTGSRLAPGSDSADRSPRSSGTAPWLTLVVLAAFAWVARRVGATRQRIRGAILATLAVSWIGCGDSAPPSVVYDSLDACVTASWVHDRASCNCYPNSGLNSPECESSDCVEADVLILDEGGAAEEFTFRRSASSGTASIVGGCAATLDSSWSTNGSDSLTTDYAVGSDYTTAITCDAHTLERPSIHFERASARTEASLASLRSGPSCGGVPWP